jgi:hypothetical protein
MTLEPGAHDGASRGSTQVARKLAATRFHRQRLVHGHFDSKAAKQLKLIAGER